MKVHRQKDQEAPQEEEKAEATDEQQAASQGTPGMIITHVRCEGTDPRRRRPELGAPAMPVTHVRGEDTDPRVARPAKVSKAIKKSSRPPQKKKGGR